MFSRTIFWLILVALTKTDDSVNLCPELSPCVCEKSYENKDFIDIDCSEKALTEIPDFTRIKTNRTVFRIQLKRNKITTIKSNAFAGITPRDNGPDQLHGGQDLSINLYQNEIASISPNAFDDVLRPYNERLSLLLDLGNNQLENLDWMFDVCKAEHADIDLYSNPILCDCKVYNITQYGVYTYAWRCSDEGKYANMYLRYWHPTISSSIVNNVTSFGYNAREECAGTSGDEIMKYSCSCKKWLPYDKHAKMNWECKYPVTVSSAVRTLPITYFFVTFGIILNVYQLIPCTKKV